MIVVEFETGQDKGYLTELFKDKWRKCFKDYDSLALYFNEEKTRLFKIETPPQEITLSVKILQTE